MPPPSSLLVEYAADCLDQVDVPPRVAAADQIVCARLRVAEHHIQSTAMIVDMKPVAYVCPIAIDRDRQPLDCCRDHRRDQLLAVLARAVVVR